MSEEEQVNQSKAKFTRRNFLKLSAVGGATLALGSRTERVKANDEIISREELESKYNLKIHDLPRDRYPDNYVELNFRKSASKIALFQKLESRRLKLNIFLVDSDHVDPSALDSQQMTALSDKQVVLNSLSREIQRVRDANRQVIQQEKPQKIDTYNRELEELNTQVQNKEISSDQFEVHRQILNYRYQPYLTDEITDDIVDRYKGTLLGTSPVLGTTKDGIPEVFIFMGIRNPVQEVTFKSGSEELTIPSVESERQFNLQPHPNQSYPSTEDLNVDLDNENYLIQGVLVPGVVLRHEMQHARGLFMEKDADLEVIKDLSAAHEKCLKGDDSDYWIVFDTPQGRTLTANPQDNFV